MSLRIVKVWVMIVLLACTARAADNEVERLRGVVQDLSVRTVTDPENVSLARDLANAFLLAGPGTPEAQSRRHA